MFGKIASTGVESVCPNCKKMCYSKKYTKYDINSYPSFFFVCKKCAHDWWS